MATISTAISTAFTPAVGTFNVQVTNGSAILERRNTSGASWAFVGNIQNSAFVCDNNITGAQYRFTSSDAGVVVQADQ